MLAMRFWEAIFVEELGGEKQLSQKQKLAFSLQNTHQTSSSLFLRVFHFAGTLPHVVVCKAPDDVT